MLNVSAKVKVKADVACYHCGYRSGEVEQDAGLPLTGGYFRPITAPDRLIPLTGRSLRCSRCGGPVFFDDTRKVIERNEPLAFEPPKRGRPRKVA